MVYIGGRRKDVVERAAAGFKDNGAGGQLIGWVFDQRYLFVPDPSFRLELDVTNKESITQAVKVIGEKHGKLDILVNKYVIPFDAMRQEMNSSYQCWSSWTHVSFSQQTPCARECIDFKPFRSIVQRGVV